MPDDIKNVAFVGLGRMGSGMAHNILKAGFNLTVHNRTAAKMAPLVEAGATGANTPREAATSADAVVTCLMDDESVLDTVTSTDGLLAGMQPGAVHICATTISPGCSAQLVELHAAHGSHYVAGPVLGRPDAAAAAQLLTFVAGDADTIARCGRLFAAYTKEVTIVGTEPGVANSVKLANNYMVISLVELIGQVYTFADKSGIDLELMQELILKIFTHPAFNGYVERIRTRAFDDAAFELAAGFKDVQLMLAASTDARAPLNYASLVREKFLAALAEGMEHKDWSAIYEITRRNAGLH